MYFYIITRQVSNVSGPIPGQSFDYTFFPQTSDLSWLGLNKTTNSSEYVGVCMSAYMYMHIYPLLTYYCYSACRPTVCLLFYNTQFSKLFVHTCH